MAREMKWAACACVIVYVALSGASAPVWAQESPAAEREADARFKAGLGRARQGKWEEARLSFLQAYALVPNAAILWNLALAELKSGHAVEALRHFGDYENSPKADRSDLQKLHVLRERAYEQVGRLLIEAPPDAKVWIDGAAQDGAAYINLAPGEHRVKVQMGDQGDERRVTLAPGQVDKESFSFALVSPLSAVATPVLPTEVLPAPTPAESHAPPSERARNRTLGWIGIGAAATTLAFGIGLTLAANAKEADAEAAVAQAGGATACGVALVPTRCADAQSAARQERTYRTLSTIGFVGTGVFAVATAGFFLFAPRSGNSVVVAPYAGPGQTGLLLQRQF
jgi:hypothetical protein